MSGSEYLTYPVETDAAASATAMIQALMALQPDWIPNESNLEVAMMEVFASKSAELQFVASQIPTAIFRYLGKSLFNIPAIDGSPATAKSTWTMRDAAGYTIPANTTVQYNLSGSSRLYFRTQADVVVAPGSTTTSTGEVVLVAVEYGSDYNGLAAQTVTLVDSLVFVASIASTTTTTGGTDPETDEAYLNRLRDDLALLSPRPILANDFAVLARSIAGVTRSVAIDNYNPADGTYNNERMVAVALADADGQPVSTPIKTAVQAYLDAEREVNFVVNIIDPTYTTVAVTVEVALAAGYTDVEASAQITAALQAYLNPAAWPWATVVRRNELIALISNQPSVDYVSNLSAPASNVTLTGAAALVNAGTITVTTV